MTIFANDRRQRPHNFRLATTCSGRVLPCSATRQNNCPNFLRCSVATIMSLVWDLTGSRFSPRPMADDRQSAAAAI